MINWAAQKPLDIMCVEAMADPLTRPWANDIIDIITARKQGQITELEADFLLWGIEETRAPRAITNPETLALARRLCVEARSTIRSIK